MEPSYYVGKAVLRIFNTCLALAAVSCATVAHGTHETISIDSSPQGAAVEMKCEKFTRHGTTPAVIQIPRNAADCVATISKDGFKSATIAFDRAPSRVYWFNFVPISVGPVGFADNSPMRIGGDTALAILLTGIVVMAGDASDGAMSKDE